MAQLKSLFVAGFGSRKSWKKLKPNHQKIWIEKLLLIFLVFIGEEKNNDIFAKKDEDLACKWLDVLLVQGHEPKKVLSFWNQNAAKLKEGKKGDWEAVAAEGRNWVRLVRDEVRIVVDLCCVAEKNFSFFFLFEKES